MKALLLCLVGLPAFASSAHVQARYDEKLEAAVKSVVAARIGDIRPGLAMGGAPLGPIAAPRDDAGPAPQPRAWTIVGGGLGLAQSASGSFQTFSDGATATPAQRKAWSNKTVSRVVNF